MYPNIPQYLYIDGRNVTNEFKILEGVSSSGTFFDVSHSKYNAEKNPVNWDDSYKRTVFQTYKHMFYSYKNEPEYQFGVERENEGPNGEYEIRDLKNRMVVAKIPQPIFGEKIVPTSLKINDRSNLNTELNIVDDGFTNLVFRKQEIGVTGSVGANFTDIQEINAEINLEVYLDPKYRKYDPQNERFGYSVSAWGDYLLIGAPMDSESFSNSRPGKSELYKFDYRLGDFRFLTYFYSPFTQVGFSRETATDNSQLFLTEFGDFINVNTWSVEDRFGQSVSINNNFAAIGSVENRGCGFGENLGAVYIYDKYKGGADHWGLIDVIVGENENDKFGNSVSITDDWLAVGASNYDTGSGAVYIFKREVIGVTIPSSSFVTILTDERVSSLCPKILSNESNEYDIIDEETTPSPISLIGNNTYVLHQKIVPFDGSAGEFFGGDVRISGSYLVVGNDKQQASGSVYIYEYNFGFSGSWNFLQKLQGNSTLNGTVNFFDSGIVPVDHPLTNFGNSVAINNKFVLIGSPSDRWYYEYQGATELYKAGAVYVYEKIGSYFSFVEKIFANERDSLNDQFGYSIDSKNDKIIVGSLIGKNSLSSSYQTSSSDFVIEDFDKFSVNITDEVNTNGKTYFYNINTLAGNFNSITAIQNVRENKLENAPKRAYGYSVALSENNIGFVGCPNFNYASPNTTEFYDQIVLREKYPFNSSGSVFSYDLNLLSDKTKLGNVFYKDGIIAITATGSTVRDTLNPVKSRFGFDIEFVSEHTVNEYEIFCEVEPGEFNVSTNPTSVKRERILYDVNNDGIFDEKDLDLILRFIKKYVLYKSNQKKKSTFEDERGIILEQNEDWWNDAALLAESIDVIYVNSIIDVVLTESESIIIDADLDPVIYEYLKYLLDSGFLDLNGDGSVDMVDAKILFNYFFSLFNFDNIRDNIGSLRDTTQIITILNEYTGKNSGFLIDPNFLNYQESSSLDKTGSYLAPYVTTLGLYSGYELVAVAKVAKPYKITTEFPITFRVTFDF